MLLHLNVQNLALSDKTEVEFYKGLICITGETGAGKSLIIDALTLLSGSKTDAHIVREGTDKCTISALFSSSNRDLFYLLKEKDLLDDDDDIKKIEDNLDKKYKDYLQNTKDNLSDNTKLDSNDFKFNILLSRSVTKDGKSKAYVNSKSVTISMLKEIAPYLISIHGQHASIKLLDEKNQLESLDAFATLQSYVQDVNDAFNSYNEKRQLLTKLSQEQKEGALTFKKLRLEKEELKRLNLKEGDYEELERLFDKGTHQNRLNDAIASTISLLDDNEDNVINLISRQISDLTSVQVFERKLKTVIESMNEALLCLDDAKEELTSIYHNMEFIDTHEVENKMAKCHELSRKFMVSPSLLYQHEDVLNAKIARFLSLKDEIEELKVQVIEKREEYEDKALILSKKRAEAALKMSESVSDKIHSLAMNDAKFLVDVIRDDTCKPRAFGRDNVKFLFAGNLGQSLHDLGAVASGGELSRIALTIEVLTSSINSTETIIFDEVDTGISGRTASAVGALLKELSKNVQVITVTHLPQVAAFANLHFLVAKFNDNNKVSSTITSLDEDSRIDEIARMMGGNVVTSDTKKSALQLLQGQL